MTSSMFAPVDSEAVSGGDPQNTASTGQHIHHGRPGGGVLLAVDSLLAAGTNAASLGYEAECSSGLNSVHPHHRTRTQHQNNNNAHISNSQTTTNGKRTEEDTNFSPHRLGLGCHTPYGAEMQPATQFYLGFNPAFAHQSHFGPTGFSTSYMSHYPISASLNPYNNQLHHPQPQPQLQQSRSPHLQSRTAAAAAAAAAAVAAAASVGGSRSLVPLTPSVPTLAAQSSYQGPLSNCSAIGYSTTPNYSFPDSKGSINLDLSHPDPRSPSFGTCIDNGLSSDQQHKAETSFLARPQPTRPLPGGDTLGGGLGLNSTSSPTALNPHGNVNEGGSSSSSLQRSQSSTSPAALSSSAMAFRDKLGLRSPPVGHPSPANSSSATPGGSCLSPAADVRCPSRSSTGGIPNHKFRYPSGPSSASMGSSPRQSVAGEGGCATPLSALSSREGTPIPPQQKIDEPAPNVDISRVQIEDHEKRAQLHHATGFMKQEPAPTNHLKNEVTEFSKQESTLPQMKEEPPNYNYVKQEGMSYNTKQESNSFNENFHKYIQENRDQQHLMIHQQQQQQQQQHLMSHSMHHHQYPGFASGNNNPISPAGSDGANNNLLSRQNITLQQRAKSLYNVDPRSHHHTTPYHPAHQASYNNSLHYHGPSALTAQGAAHGVSPPSIPGRMAGATGRGGSTVKIGRRPSHLPKVLKFQDGTLPPGWVRKLKCRKHGKQAGRWDVYIYSPCGVKFASRKKLKSFFEKNNLNYDPEDFDFTPYGRHSDHSTGRGGGSSSGGGGAGSASGRHNSSGSTGSEATHAGSSPASLNNHSPTHFGSTATSSYLAAHNMMSSGFAGAVNEYSTPFGTFDPHMENPPNVNALDVQRIDNFGTSLQGGVTSSGMGDSMSSSGNRTTLDYHPGRGHHHPLKTESGDSSYMDMADFFGDSSTAVAVAAALPLHNGSLYPATSNVTTATSGMNPEFSDLNHEALVGGRDLLLAHGLNPLSNASMGSRGSDEDLDDSVSSKTQDMSELGKAFNVMNDEFQYN